MYPQFNPYVQWDKTNCSRMYISKNSLETRQLSWIAIGSAGFYTSLQIRPDFRPKKYFWQLPYHEKLK